MTRPRQSKRRLRVTRSIVLSTVTLVSVVGLYFFHKFQVRREAFSIKQRAAAAFEQRDWPLSVSLYRSYLRFEPEDTDGLELFAGSLEELVKTSAPGKLPELVSTYEKLRQYDSLTPKLRRRLAWATLRSGRAAGARDAVGPLVTAANDKPDAELLEILGQADEIEGNAKAAITRYKDAVATGSADAETYLRLATLIRADSLNPNAIAEADAVIGDLGKARANDLKARWARARYFDQHGMPKEALAELEYAVKSIPGTAADLNITRMLVTLAVAEKNYALALETLLKARDAHPKDLGLVSFMARVQLTMNDTAAARKTLLTTLEKPLPANQLTLDIADLFIELGDPAAVAKIAAGFTKPELAFLADYLNGRLKMHANDWPAALPLFVKACDNGLDRIPVHNVLAQINLAGCYALADWKVERLKAASEAARVAAKLSPALRTRALLTQAEAFLAIGELAKAAKIYEDLAPDSPEAREAFLTMQMEQELKKPPAQQKWAEVERLFGPELQPPEIEVVRAKVLDHQGKRAEAIALLEKVVASPAGSLVPGPASLLARMLQPPEAGLRVLDAAASRIGDRVEFRVARLDILTRSPNSKPAEIAALAENVGSFKPADRADLFAAVAGTLARLGKSAEALPLMRKAAAENPYNLTLRVDLFRLGLAVNDLAVQDEALKGIDTLDKAGATRTIMEVTRELSGVKPGDTVKADALLARLEPADKQRPDSAPIAVLQGDLEFLAGRGGRALTRFLRARELGDDSLPVLTNTVQLLCDRQRNPEALNLLNQANQRGQLSENLARQLVLLRSAYGENSEQNVKWARSQEAKALVDYRNQLVRAAILEANDAPDEARQAVEQALNLKPDAADAWVQVVRLSVAAGKPTEAKALAETAAQKLPVGDPSPDVSAGNALALSTIQEIVGDRTRAVAYARQARTLLPTEPATNHQLSRLLRRDGKPAEADKVYEELVDNPAAKPEVRRSARRSLAYERVVRSKAPASITAALDLIKRNIAEAGNSTPDVRARALVKAFDPFRQLEAIKELTESAKDSPLTAEESYRLGRIYFQQGQLDKADEALTAATADAILTQPDYFASLAQVRLRRGQTAAAEKAVTRLKARFPRTWEAVSEEARLLAGSGRGAEATKLIADSDFARDPDTRVRRVAPLLEEIGLPAEAERLYREAAKGPGPLTFVPLVNFLLNAGRAVDAVELIDAHEASAPVEVTARLLATAARGRPVKLLPPDQQAEWEKTVARIDGWVTKKQAAAPVNPDLLFAKALLDNVNGRHGDELRAYETLTRLAPENDIYANNLALVLALHQNDTSDRPMKLINGVIARLGPEAAALDTRAVIRTIRGEYDDAISDLNAAIGLVPKAVYYFHLALAEEGKAGQGGPMTARDAAWKEAKRLGLTKASLDPQEWPAFDRLLPAK